MHFREGALVKAGDLLLTIDPAPYQADVDRADAQVFAAQSRLTNAKSNYERAKQLLRRPRDLADASTTTASTPRARPTPTCAPRRPQLQTAQLSLGYTQVRAPVSGRVGKLEITTGNLVAAGPGAPVLTTLVSVSPIYASFDADEQVVTRALRELPAGASARAQIEKIPVQMGTVADTATPIAGHLQLVDNQVDASSGTVRVRAVFDNADGALMPGQFAHLRMGQVKADAGAADQRARGRHRPEQEVRDGGRRRRQGAVPRGHARRQRRRPAHRHRRA